MAKPIKDFLEKFLNGNAYLKGFLDELAKGGLKDILSGDNIHELTHKLAAVLLALKAAKGYTDDFIIEEASEWLDKKFKFPMPIELADGIIFKCLVKSAIKAIQREGNEDPETQQLIADAIEAIKAGDIEIV